MKKTMFILVSVLMFSLQACSNTGDVNQKNSDSTKQTWIFSFTTVQSVDPAMTGYPITTIKILELSDLTPAEADEVIKELSLTTSMTNNGYKFTSTITGSKTAKK